MDLVFAPEAWEDYLYWQHTDAKVISRINLLLKEITRNPYAGIGKPEPLKHVLQGYCSRRINSEHRIVYKKAGNQILIAQLRYHYR
ncbi:MAG: Txe/YoeB family addiction module toxin [Verrucomicrobia bacterium]|nr:MAG: Txe/YoeB family addiction module toxin [Verrucomicrobiota bacterium]PYL85866.1 MAG: Txe/YoeB family addiction module toxin [Verrucomicrobiota bacterium]TMP93083.1 MAG: Txe/YoeB family addiction module toxin [Verrucomicrobiota bacterium]